VRVLMVTLRLPTSESPNTMSPLMHQIRSLEARGIEVGVCEVKGKRKLKYIQAVPSFWSAVASYDLIHAHFGHCGWLGRMQLRKPLVVSFMGSDLLGTPKEGGRIPPLSKVVVQANKRLARMVSDVIVKSAEMAKVIEPVKAHVIPNGVDLQHFRPMDRAEAKRCLELDPNKRYVLFPGNPRNPRKAYPIAQAAVEIVANRYEEPVELLTLYPTPPEKVPLYMNACDVELLTSYVEGSPNVVKEAMACNLPIVSVDTGDVTQLLDGVEGCSIQPRAPEPLADALISVLERDQATNGREILQHKGLDIESVAKQIHDIYIDVLA